jgi:hypothetical protein
MVTSYLLIWAATTKNTGTRSLQLFLLPAPLALDLAVCVPGRPDQYWIQEAFILDPAVCVPGRPDHEYWIQEAFTLDPESRAFLAPLALHPAVSVPSRPLQVSTMATVL